MALQLRLRGARAAQHCVWAGKKKRRLGARGPGLADGENGGRGDLAGLMRARVAGLEAVKGACDGRADYSVREPRRGVSRGWPAVRQCCCRCGRVVGGCAEVRLVRGARDQRHFGLMMVVVMMVATTTTCCSARDRVGRVMAFCSALAERRDPFVAMWVVALASRIGGGGSAFGAFSCILLESRC